VNEWNTGPHDEGATPSEPTPPQEAPAAPETPAASEEPEAPQAPGETPVPAHDDAEAAPEVTAPVSPIPWWEAPAAPESEEPAASAPESPAPQPPPSGKALLVVGLALMLALLGVGGIAAKLWYDQTAAQDALLAAVGAIGATVSPDLADTLNPRIAEIRTAISNGQYAEATSRLRHILEGTGKGTTGAGELGGPLSARGAGDATPGATPEGQQAQQAGQLPPGVMEFFQKHEKLAALFGQANTLGVKLRDSGGDVTRLREIHNQIIAAAQQNDEAGVERLLLQFRDELRVQVAKLGPKSGMTLGHGPGTSRPGGPGRSGPAAPPAEFLSVLRQVDGAMRQAQTQGKDLRQPMQMLREAEGLARSRNFSAATRAYRNALEAIRNAPELPAEPQLFQNPLVSMFVNLLQVEDQELAGTLNNLKQTYQAAKADLTQQWTQTLDSTIDVLKKVGARRHVFGERLEQIRTGKVSTEDLRKTQEAARQKAQAESRTALEGILDRVQTMKPEDFAAQRTKLVDEILQAVFSPPKAGGQQQPTAVAAPPVVAGTAEQRVREKLLQAAGPYLKVQQDPTQKELAGRLGQIFGQARELLAAGKAEEAEKLADQGLELLKPPAPAPAAQTP
jgi:hypothetical protein